MATPTATSAIRPTVRTAVTIDMKSVPVLALDWANGQAVTTSGTSAASAVFDALNDRIIEVCANADCWIKVGPGTPTAVAATAGNQFLAAGSVRYVYVPLNDKIAAIQSSAAGSVGMVPALILT